MARELHDATQTFSSQPIFLFLVRLTTKIPVVPFPIIIAPIPPFTQHYILCPDILISPSIAHPTPSARLAFRSAIQIERCTDQRQMTERLRRVA